MAQGIREFGADRSAPSVDVLGKLTGLLVFLAGIILLGLVFVYTVRTISAAEGALRDGGLVMAPLFGEAPRPDVPHSVSSYQPSGSAAIDSGGSGAEDSKQLSPLVRFGLVLGSRIVGLCVLGFLAGVIATQGARMSGAFRALNQGSSS